MLFMIDAKKDAKRNELVNNKTKFWWAILDKNMKF
jgi:hypothetical protein